MLEFLPSHGPEPCWEWHQIAKCAQLIDLQRLSKRFVACTTHSADLWQTSDQNVANTVL